MRRRGGTGSFAAAIVAACVIAGAGFLLSRPPESGGPPVAPEAPLAPRVDEPPSVRVRVRSVVGRVERSDGSRWVGLADGDYLDENDSLRTLADGRVGLQVSDEDSAILVEPQSELEIGELTAAVHRMRLARGRIGVDYSARAERSLRLENEDGSVVAQSRAGRFTLLSTGVMVAVATEGGSVSFEAAGGRVEVGAGQQSVAIRGEKPSAAAPIPEEVLLQVARSLTREEVCMRLVGRVRLGATVTVDGQPAHVLEDGRFEVTVPRRPGVDKVRVVATELAGRVREEALPCQRIVRRVLPPDEASVRVKWDE